MLHASSSGPSMLLSIFSINNMSMPRFYVSTLCLQLASASLGGHAGPERAGGQFKPAEGPPAGCVGREWLPSLALHHESGASLGLLSCRGSQVNGLPHTTALVPWSVGVDCKNIVTAKWCSQVLSISHVHSSARQECLFCRVQLCGMGIVRTPIACNVHKRLCATTRLQEAWVWLQSPAAWHRFGRSVETDSLQCKTQGDNFLTSTIPASWLRVGSLPRLFYFSLAQNELVGTIPTPEPYCSLCGFRVGRPLLHQPG